MLEASLDYVTASATIGELGFGVFDFVYAVVAIVLAVGLKLFLPDPFRQASGTRRRPRTRTGRPSSA